MKKAAVLLKASQDGAFQSQHLQKAERKALEGLDATQATPILDKVKQRLKAERDPKAGGRA